MATNRRDCDHILFIGDFISFTDQRCPRAELFMGNFTVKDRECKGCKAYRNGNQKVRKKYG